MSTMSMLCLWPTYRFMSPGTCYGTCGTKRRTAFRHLYTLGVVPSKKGIKYIPHIATYYHYLNIMDVAILVILVDA